MRPVVTCLSAFCLAAVLAGIVACGRIDYGVVGAGPHDAGASDASPSGADARSGDDADVTPRGDGGDGGDAMAGGDAAPGSDAGPGCADIDLGSAVGSPVYSGTTAGQGNDYNACLLGIVAPDVSLAWTAPQTGRYTFDTCGSSFNTVLRATADTCTGTSLACQDDGCGQQSRFSLDLVAADRVILVVDSVTGSGAFVLNITASVED